MAKQHSFFRNYPTRELKQDGVTKTIVDLSRYVRSSNDLLLKKYQYFDYEINGSERPDQVSYKVYGSTEFYWVILVTNNIRNIWTEWPLGQNEFESYIVKKYGSISAAQSSVYRYIAQQDIYKGSTVGGTLPELIIANGEPIDATTVTDYSLVGAPSNTDYRITSDYEREVDLNNDKRKIKLVNKVLVSTIRDELKTLFGD